MITPRQALPKNWTRLLTGGPIGVGGDLATTEKKTSNPSSITVMERAKGLYIERLVLRFKTNSEEVFEAMLRCVLEDIREQQKKARRLCLDASSEVFFAQSIKRKFITFCPIDLVKGGETIQRGAEKFSYKVLLGNLYSTAFEDALIAMPDEKWLKDDHRRVQRDKGSFITETGENGEHGDTFDSGKLALWALEHGTGRVEADAVQIGNGVAGQQTQRPGIRNPFARFFRPHGKRTNF
jgi:hypothetical protein